MFFFFSLFDSTCLVFLNNQGISSYKNTITLSTFSLIWNKNSDHEFPSYVMTHQCRTFIRSQNKSITSWSLSYQKKIITLLFLFCWSISLETRLIKLVKYAWNAVFCIFVKMTREIIKEMNEWLETMKKIPIFLNPILMSGWSQIWNKRMFNYIDHNWQIVTKQIHFDVFVRITVHLISILNWVRILIDGIAYSRM